jgi:DNA ligase-1
MLASPADMASLRFPLIASFKLDGVRATIHNGVAMSRSMKPIPNSTVQLWARAHPGLEGADGELIVGPPNLPTTFRATTSAVMSRDEVSLFSFYAFDRHDLDLPYVDRLRELIRACANIPGVVMHRATVVRTLADIEAYEAQALAEGYEGIMLRDPAGLYKQGRSTAREGTLLKVKRHEDMEARVVGVEERLHNGNEAFKNEIGRTSRSSHQAGKVGLDTLGALTVVGLNGPYEGVQFSVGTGFDDTTRANLWPRRTWPEGTPGALLGRVAKVKYFPLGSKDAPRHPVWVGWRDPMDMGGA